MPKPIIRPFAFNDETIENTYGFSIVTSGIDLTRFLKNPVMLSDHYNSNWNVIGKWFDVKKEASVLSGLPDFDTEDTDTAVIAGKVERGYINACSMGIIFDRENLTVVAGKVILTKCELVEVSIVPVPSNANAVRLMHADGKLMEEK
jgi:phage head maturation protease